MICFSIEFMGVQAPTSSVNLIGIEHMCEDSKGSVWQLICFLLKFLQQSYRRSQVISIAMKLAQQDKQKQYAKSVKQNRRLLLSMILCSQLIYNYIMNHPETHPLNDESPSESTKRIRKKFNIYMSETSKYNPFGPNSISSTQQEKKIFKYNLMKEYIKLTTKDELYKEYEQSRLLGTLILSFVGGYFAAFAFTTIITRGKNLKSDYHGKWNSLLYAFCMTTGFGYQYFASTKRYNINVCEYILNKYLPQAIQNGFEDYEISK